MKSPDRCETGGQSELYRVEDWVADKLDERKNREPLEVERLLISDQRRPRRSVTIDDHQRFREAIARPSPGDEIDELVEELRAGEFEGRGAQP